MFLSNCGKSRWYKMYVNIAWWWWLWLAPPSCSEICPDISSHVLCSVSCGGSACVSSPAPGSSPWLFWAISGECCAVATSGQWVVSSTARQSRSRKHAAPPRSLNPVMIIMRPASLLYLLGLACLLAAQPGRWDHHPTRRSFSRRIPTPTPPAVRTTTDRPARSSRISVPPRERPRGSRGGSRAWDHALGWSVPAERCQIPADARHLPGAKGAPLHSYYIDYVNELLVQDKTVLSPVVFEGAMVSRTNTYKNLYFVSFKVFRVLKGHIHQQLQGHIRLLFQTESRRTNYKSKTIKNCPPVPFNVRSGRKYLVFVKNLVSPGRFIAVAKPEVVRRKSMREVKQILSCDFCGKSCPCTRVNTISPISHI